ncbi:MAG: hypothetical protein Q9222_004601 [Ikaeria aurantiellina]
MLTSPCKRMAIELGLVQAIADKDGTSVSAKELGVGSHFNQRVIVRSVTDETGLKLTIGDNGAGRIVQLVCYILSQDNCGSQLLCDDLDTGTIGPVSDMKFFRQDIAVTSPILQGLIVSSVLLPSAIFSFFAGTLADAVGRPRAATIGFCIFGFGAAIEAASIHIAIFIVGRIIIGIGNGLSLSTVAVYICELAPAAKRGVLTTLESQSLWVRLGARTDSEDTEVSDGIVSENHEEKEGKTDGRSCRPSTAVIPGLAQSQLEDSTAKVSHSFIRVFRKDVRSRTALGVYYLGMQQLCGIDSILYYAPIVFQQAGITSQKSSFLASGVTAIVIVAVTVPATLTADSWSRRMQTMVGGCLISGCLFLNAILYASGLVHRNSGAARWVVIVTIYVFVISYCVTWGMCVRSYPSEIQPPAMRATATSLAQSANWVSG